MRPSCGPTDLLARALATGSPLECSSGQETAYFGGVWREGVAKGLRRWMRLRDAASEGEALYPPHIPVWDLRQAHWSRGVAHSCQRSENSTSGGVCDQTDQHRAYRWGGRGEHGAGVRLIGTGGRRICVVDK